MRALPAQIALCRQETCPQFTTFTRRLSIRIAALPPPVTHKSSLFPRTSPVSRSWFAFAGFEQTEKPCADPRARTAHFKQNGAGPFARRRRTSCPSTVPYLRFAPS